MILGEVGAGKNVVVFAAVATLDPTPRHGRRRGKPRPSERGIDVTVGCALDADSATLAAGAVVAGRGYGPKRTLALTLRQLARP